MFFLFYLLKLSKDIPIFLGNVIVVTLISEVHFMDSVYLISYKNTAQVVLKGVTTGF